MKNLKSILFSLLAIMAVAVSLTSCEQNAIVEEDLEGLRLSSLLAEYPEEITIDNWEEFVYAPNEVIDYYQRKETSMINSTIESGEIQPEILSRTQYGSFEVGFIKAFNSSSDWSCLGGAKAKRSNCTSTSFGSSCWQLSGVDHDINYLTSCLSGVICMSYQTTWLNGVDEIDLDLIQRHILGLEVFTDARQYIAADINGNGVISGADLVQLRRLIIGIHASIPNRENIVFLPDVDYDYFNENLSDVIYILPSFTDIPNCLLNLENRYAIKIGDVNGTFNF